MACAARGATAAAADDADAALAAAPSPPASEEFPAAPVQRAAAVRLQPTTAATLPGHGQQRLRQSVAAAGGLPQSAVLWGNGGQRRLRQPVAAATDAPTTNELSAANQQSATPAAVPSPAGLLRSAFQPAYPFRPTASPDEAASLTAAGPLVQSPGRLSSATVRTARPCKSDGPSSSAPQHTSEAEEAELSSFSFLHFPPTYFM